MITFDTRLDRILNEMGYFSGGTFGHNGGIQYSVEKTVRWASGVVSITRVNVRRLARDLFGGGITADEPIGSSAYKTRSNESSLEYPILVVRSDNEIWIGDGSHRLYKAYKEGRRYINAYVVNEEDIPIECQI